MNLSRHLRYFLVTAEELNFGRAAEMLGIAQPPLSQAIKRLERELGVDLFDRSRRQVQLTVAGRLLMREARAHIAGEERLRTLMRKIHEGALGTLRAGVLPETPAVLLRALLESIAGEMPELDIDLYELPTAEQLRQLLSAGLDVGLVEHPIEAADLAVGRHVDIPLGVVLPRQSPLAGQREIALADLGGHALITAPRATSPSWHDRLLQTCREHGFIPSAVRHASNPEFLLGLVLAERGIAFEPESTARREPRAAWRPLTGTPLIRRISAVWPARPANPAAERFAHLAAEVLNHTETAPPLSRPPTGTRPWSVINPRGIGHRNALELTDSA